jgi:Kef-type K+ transport system membrane component KefB
MLETFLLIAGVIVVWVIAKVFGFLFEQCKLPSLFGEILAGALLGPFAFQIITPSPLLKLLATLGSIVLLFSIGLETKLERIWRVGRSAVVTATLGVLLPFGFIALAGMLLHYSPVVSLFLATAGSATSIGITMRVLKDANALNTTASRIILGAAVLDDVLDIVALAVIATYATTGSLPGLDLLLVIAQIAIFITVVILFLPQIMRHAERSFPSKRSAVPLAMVSMVCLSALSAYVGLAAIVGAFLSGITFAESRSREHITTFVNRHLSFLIPFFFIGIGINLNLRLSTHALIAGGVITVVAILGKLLAGYLATYEHGSVTAWAVGMGMVPRGEVGLIVASSGLALGVLDRDVVGVMILVILVTTLCAPLTITILRRGKILA